MNSFRKFLLMAASMQGLMQENERLFEKKEHQISVGYRGEEHNSLHQTERKRKTRKNRRRIASRMRAYNRNH